MAEFLTPHKALTVNPLKASQPIGASLAFLGLAQAMPLEHGARGCASFNKLFFMRHFHEPIALQTTAMDQTTTVLGADDSVVEALKTICEKSQPQVIGLISTGLSELQGADLARTIDAFRKAYPTFAAVAVVPVSASDTLGRLESGFAAAVEALIEHLVLEQPTGRRRPQQVNVLASAMLTPGDVDEIKRWIEIFGLTPIVLPDLADSLDGHLDEAGFLTLTYGGVSRSDIADMGLSAATLVIGPSLERAADALRRRTGVPDHRFAGLTGLEASDAFTACLAQIADRPVPPIMTRRRDQLLDAMVDCQFQLGGARVALAADPDLLGALSRFMTGMGMDLVAAVASARVDALADLAIDHVVIGDLEDLEWLAQERRADLVVANSHGLDLARRIGAALLRVGFPIYDQYGAHAQTWVGYGGTRRALFEIANLLAAHHQEIRPYRSVFWRGGPRDAEPQRTTAC